MKIKVIDLLQMKAKNEKMPKEIIYDGIRWKLDNNYDEAEEFGKEFYDEFYYNDEIGKCLFEDYIDKKWYITEVLNGEVEIVEEPKKIEKIDIYDDNNLIMINGRYDRDNTHLIFAQKLNEVIDKINEMSDK